MVDAPTLCRRKVLASEPEVEATDSWKKTDRIYDTKGVYPRTCEQLRGYTIALFFVILF